MEEAYPPYWTATEAITYLALGQPVPLAEVHEYWQRFERRWRVPDNAGSVLALLQARAAPHPSYPIPWQPTGNAVVWSGPPPVVPYCGPSSPRQARAIRAGLRLELGKLISYREAAQLLQQDMHNRDVINERIKAVLARLIRALLAESIRVFGIRDSDPASEFMPVPFRLFLMAVTIRNDRIEADAEASFPAYEQARDAKLFHSLKFQSADVILFRRNEWPYSSPPPSEMEKATMLNAYFDSMAALARYSKSAERPAAVEEKASTTPLAHAAPAELRRWYIRRVKDWPIDKKHPSAADDLKAAVQDHPGVGVTREAIRDLRRELAPEVWKQHGRRKNSRE